MAKKIKQVSPADLVYFVLSSTFIKNPKLESITRKSIYEGFKILSEKHQNEFSKFYFTQTIGGAYSNELEDILFSLSGVITQDAIHRIVSFSKETLEVSKTQLNRFYPDSKDKQQIFNFAEEFYKTLKV